MAAETTETPTESTGHTNDNSKTGMYVDGAAGGIGNRFVLGVGSWTPDTASTAIGYISHYSSKGMQTRRDVKMGDHETTITAIGIGGLGFEAKKTKMGGELALELSYTESQDYGRIGFGVRMGVVYPFVKQLFGYASATLRPEFASIDWNSDTLGEVDYELGVDYLVTKDVSVYAHYMSSNVLLNGLTNSDVVDQWNLISQVAGGIRARF